MSLLKSAFRSVVPEPIYDAMRRAKQSKMTRGFSSYDVEHTYCGRSLKMHIADPVAAEWYDRPWKNVPEIDYIQSIDLEGSTIFDIGAHQCLIAMLLGKITGETGKVIAVEANGHNHKVAQKNFELNNCQNVTCINALVSSGNIAVSVDGGLNGRARTTRASEGSNVLTIDQMTDRFGAPALVFLDIEGHEIEALSGAQSTLSETDAHWFIELHGDELLSTYKHKNTDVFKFFDKAKFSARVLNPEATEFVDLTPDSLISERCHVFFKRL